jgi:ATP-dependent helicase Lhr and Lhr-like helicase
MEEELSLLADPLQDWVRNSGWQDFRPIQSEAIRAILSNRSVGSDFILSSMTASGKTEAAFLPLLTRIYQSDKKPRNSFEILYISPLKALINDMLGRVHPMAACIERQTYRRHGDVSGKERQGVRGILLTTPESLEAQFIRAYDKLPLIFRDLQAVVLDEVHAYFESPRGPQVISLLTRLEALLAEESGREDHQIPRIALSATLSGQDAASQADLKAFLRPEDPECVQILCPEATKDRIVIHLKVFRDIKRGELTQTQRAETRETLMGKPRDINLPDLPAAVDQIADSLFEIFSACHKGLIFTNSRREAEDFAELLNLRARERGKVQTPEGKDGDEGTGDNLEAEYSPETRLFWPHHGSLDTSIRSRAEKTMRDQKVKSILVCTTTLELGIDIGMVEATAQIGSGYSVASLRQRLGRSGRRKGMVPTLYAYVRESDLGEGAHLLDQLHLQTFRTLAQIHLLNQGAFEPPDLQRLNLSTLIQQLLSCIHQYQEDQGIDLALARHLLVERGPFQRAGRPFEPLIEHLSTKYKPLIEVQDDRLFLTPLGKKVVENYTFYAAFPTPEEYGVVAGGRRIGAFAARYPYGPGDRFLFAGTYWEVVRVNHIQHIIEVRRTSSGRAPNFQGDPLAPSDLIVEQMYRIYSANEDPELPQDTNEAAREAVLQGRTAFCDMFQTNAHLIQHGDDVMLFPWVGTRRQFSLVALLKWKGLAASAMDVSILMEAVTPDQALKAIQELESDSLPGEHDLARLIPTLTFEKHDKLLSPALKRLNFASAKFDVPSLPGTIKRLMASSHDTVNYK